MTPFELSEQDKTAFLWLRLKAYFEDRLSDARKRNDALLPEAETAALRGEIRILKKIVMLGDTRPNLTGDTEAPPGPSPMETFNG